MNRQTQLKDIVSDSIESVRQEVLEYQKSNPKAERFTAVQQLFERVKEKGKGSLPSVKISEIDLSQNDRNINKESSEFLALKESIKDQGLLQRPILTLGVSSSKPFLCVAGHRRILALQSLGVLECPAELMFPTNENDVQLARLAENLVRQNLRPLELAESVSRVKSRLNESTSGVARILNKNRAYVTELLKIAEWPKEAKEIVEAKNLGIRKLGHIAKRKLSDQEVIEELQSISNSKVSGSPTLRRKKSQLKMGDFRKYCSERKLKEDEITLVTQILIDLKLLDQLA